MRRGELPDLILRIGLAFAFLYPSLDALVDPHSWIGYFPRFVQGIVPDLLLLHAFGALEVVLALWILSGWKIFIPSLLAAALLVGIVALNGAQFPILFRDLSIAALALSLAITHAPGMEKSPAS